MYLSILLQQFAVFHRSETLKSGFCVFPTDFSQKINIKNVNPFILNYLSGTGGNYIVIFIIQIIVIIINIIDRRSNS